MDMFEERMMMIGQKILLLQLREQDKEVFPEKGVCGGVNIFWLHLTTRIGVAVNEHELYIS